MGTRQEELDQFDRERQIITNQETILNALADVKREILLVRKGQEVGIYGEEVEDMEDVDGVPDKEVEDV